MGICQTIAGTSEPSRESRSGQYLHVTAYTWQKESHGLFDFESKSFVKTSFDLQSSARLIRVEHNVIVTDNLVGDEDGSLLTVSYADDQFFVIPNSKKTTAPNPAIQAQDNSLWLVAKSVQSSTNSQVKQMGHRLSEDDLIKLGRVRFKVKELVCDGINRQIQRHGSKESSFMKDDALTQAKANQVQNDTSSVRSVITCRICLMDGNESDNPFISPCNCSGTVKYIHINCLQLWLKSKLTTKQTPTVTSIVWKSLECELCKRIFPSRFDINGKRYDSIEIPYPTTGKYIVLEMLSKEKNQPKGFHIIDFSTKNSIKMGRGHDNDVRVTDISVSRCHVSLVMENGGVYIVDNQSKFGTLIMVKEPRQITKETPEIAFQIGRTVVEFSVKKMWKILPALCGKRDDVVDKVVRKQAPEAVSLLPENSRNVGEQDGDVERIESEGINGQRGGARPAQGPVMQQARLSSQELNEPQAMVSDNFSNAGPELPGGAL
eukprot:TRINITY_DN4354_c0_g1_i1.p1 TRINITY_DN4354_c0_g1~~TRINITY_DN4354_c0_g1_i1.p1  ORF type:complete len:490 (+),score=89.00 TRINITY_DN4354_c0_g1_i1:221-1690(+)